MLEQPREDLMHRYGVRAISQFTQVTTDRLKKLADLVDQGVIKVHIDKTFPLAKTKEALEYMRTGHPEGKIVIRVK